MWCLHIYAITVRSALGRLFTKWVVPQFYIMTMEGSLELGRQHCHDIQQNVQSPLSNQGGRGRTDL